MLVQDLMQTKLVTVALDTTLPEAIRLASQRGVRTLPVLDDGKLVGIVSDRDLKRAMASSATSLDVHELMYLLDRVRMREIMTSTVIVIGPRFPIEEAARLMVLEKIGALPVTEGGRLVGIVTETDVLQLFLKAMGAGEPSRLDVILGDRPAAMAEVTHALERAGVAIASIVTLSSGGLREAIVRIGAIDPRPAIAALRAKGFAIRDGQGGRGSAHS